MRGGGGLKVEASLVGFLARFKFEKSGKEKKEFQILSVSSRNECTEKLTHSMSVLSIRGFSVHSFL